MAHVAVALSGGVDSAVAAALLQRQGHVVSAVHMKTGFFTGRGEGDAPRHAARIARVLGLSFHLWDLHSPFKQEVVEYFVCSYFRGRTPNPCVVCNPRIKFGHLLERARSLGAQFLATGHYVRKQWDQTRGRYLLRKGVDPGKDQSYFLHRLTQAQLASALFPLGEYHKSQVRELAREWGLDELVLTESQEFCFMGSSNYREFLEQMVDREAEPGEIVDLGGRVLGRHQGIHRYTIGQRRGLNLPSTEPYYVVELDPGRNRVVVGRRNDLFCQGMLVDDVHWIVEPPGKSFKALTRVRFRHREVPSTVELLNSASVRVVFEQQVRAVTPGQAAVFYQDDLMLGGGWIRRALRNV